MPKTTSFIFETKEILAAKKKHEIAFLATLFSAILLGVSAIVISLIFSDPTTLATALSAAVGVAIINTVIGTIAMNITNDEVIKTTEAAYFELSMNNLTKNLPRS